MKDKGRKFGDLLEDTEGHEEGVINVTKKLRIGSTAIDDHWRNVAGPPRSPEFAEQALPTPNSELPLINGLLKELHYYRQARKSSVAINAGATQLAESNRMSCSPEHSAVSNNNTNTNTSGDSGSDTGSRSLTAAIASYSSFLPGTATAVDVDRMDSTH